MKPRPNLAAGDMRYAADLLGRRINEFAAHIRKDPEAAALALDESMKVATSAGAQVSDLTEAAIAVRAVAIASGRELGQSDFDMLDRLGKRLGELDDDGDVVAALIVMIACRVSLR